jgi:hypothetical protein
VAEGQVVAKEAIWFCCCCIYSLTKYFAIFAEMKEYFGIAINNNQIGDDALWCSLIFIREYLESG